jgi:hypothetical protein
LNEWIKSKKLHVLLGFGCTYNYQGCPGIVVEDALRKMVYLDAIAAKKRDEKGKIVHAIPHHEDV